MIPRPEVTTVSFTTIEIFFVPPKERTFPADAYRVEIDGVQRWTCTRSELREASEQINSLLFKHRNDDH